MTTTLSKENMLAQKPDEVRPTIAEISVDLLQDLQWAARGEAAAKDRAESGKGAGPSDNVRS